MNRAELKKMSIEEMLSKIDEIVGKYPQLKCEFDRTHKGQTRMTLKQLLREVENLEDPELQDYYSFKNCIDKLDAVKKEIASFWEANPSDFGTWMALDKSALTKEYEALKASYETLEEELKPQMQASYKNYKKHCEWCRIPSYEWSGYQEEDDLFSSIMGW